MSTAISFIRMPMGNFPKTLQEGGPMSWHERELGAGLAVKRAEPKEEVPARKDEDLWHLPTL